MGQIERLSRTILTNFAEILCVGRVLETALGAVILCGGKEKMRFVDSTCLVKTWFKSIHHGL